MFICYESAFPDFVRQFAREGATVFFNLSNDGYFGHSAAREQHLSLVRMRAVENRRFIVRSTNDGLTAPLIRRVESCGSCRPTQKWRHCCPTAQFRKQPFTHGTETGLHGAAWFSVYSCRCRRNGQLG